MPVGEMLGGSTMTLVEDVSHRSENGHLPHRPPRRFIGQSRQPMAAREITEWQAFEKVAGPLGGDRDDVLAAMTAFYVVSALGAKNANLDKMLPTWDRRPQDWQQMREMLKALTVANGGTIGGQHGNAG